MPAQVGCHLDQSSLAGRSAFIRSVLFRAPLPFGAHALAARPSPCSLLDLAETFDLRVPLGTRHLEIVYGVRFCLLARGSPRLGGGQGADGRLDRGV